MNFICLNKEFVIVIVIVIYSHVLLYLLICGRICIIVFEYLMGFHWVISICLFVGKYMVCGGVFRCV